MIRRWIYPRDGGPPIEVTGLPPDHPEVLLIIGDRHYDGLKAPDGTPIDTRTKHREYLRSRGLTTADDYAQEWKTAATKRADYFTTGGDHAERREAIAQAVEKQPKRR
jgi:hypothetical protein